MTRHRLASSISNCLAGVQYREIQTPKLRLRVEYASRHGLVRGLYRFQGALQLRAHCGDERSEPCNLIRPCAGAPCTLAFVQRGQFLFDQITERFEVVRGLDEVHSSHACVSRQFLLQQVLYIVGYLVVMPVDPLHLSALMQQFMRAATSRVRSRPCPWR